MNCPPYEKNFAWHLFLKLPFQLFNQISNPEAINLPFIISPSILCQNEGKEAGR